MPQCAGIWRPPELASSAEPTAAAGSPGRHPEGEHQRLVAVVGEEPVVAGAQRTGEGEEQCFVAGTCYLEMDATLPLKGDLAVVKSPGGARRGGSPL